MFYKSWLCWKLRVFPMVVSLLFSSAVYGDNYEGICTINGQPQKEKIFKQNACAICYFLIDKPSVFVEKFTLGIGQDLSYHLKGSSGELYKPDFRNVNGPVYRSFKEQRHAEKWADCCKAAGKCCDESLKEQKINGNETNGCNRDWDSYYCWAPAQPDTINEGDCPDYHTAYYLEKRTRCKRIRQRECGSNGQWEIKFEADYLCDNFEFQRQLEDYNETQEEVDYFQKGCQRTERGVELSYQAYELDTCAKCYSYMPATLGNTRLIYVEMLGALVDNVTGQRFYAQLLRNHSGNSTEEIISSLKPDKFKLNMFHCCTAAMDCWDEMKKKKKSRPPDWKERCPMTWDGWTCFDYGVPGQKSYKDCQDHVYFNMQIDYTRDCKKQSEKTCQKNGTWFKRFDISANKWKEWTDYQTCVDTDAIRNFVIFEMVFLCISLASIVPALIIFNIYRTLRIPRIKMHVQLMLSLFLYCFSTTIFKGIVLINEVNGNPTNPKFCQFLVIAYKYFRFCSYSWMLCEGYYLHRQIAAAFSEQRKFWYFYVVGWGIPFGFTAVYAFIRAYATTDYSSCWVTPSILEPILYSPTIFSLVLNLMFLCHIVYILVTKLRSVQSNEPGYFRKAVRATLVLIPLFGVHYFLIMYSPKPDDACISKLMTKYITAVVDGLQGFAVALIYCYLNHEVLNLLKSDYYRYKAKNFLGGMQSARPSRGGRWSVSTQVSAVNDGHSTNTPPRCNNARRSNGSMVPLATLEVPPSRVIPRQTNGHIPTTDL